MAGYQTFGIHGLAALQFHGRCCDLDDAGIEVHGGAVRQMVRGADAVHQRSANEASRVAEERFGADRPVVDHQCELGFETDGGMRQRIEHRGAALARLTLGRRGVPPFHHPPLTNRAGPC